MPEHLANTVTQDVHSLLPLLVAHGLSVVGAIAILIIGLWLSGKSHVLVIRMLGKAPHLDEMLVRFFGAIIRYLILIVTLLAVLSQFGIQTTSLVAVLGAAGLAIGLALQGTLSSLAAGIMLLIFRPFKIGDAVQIGGIQGTVKELALFWTELITGDNVQIIVPNNGVWGHSLRNFSTYPVRGIEVQFRIPETTNLDAALAATRSLVESDPRVVQTRHPPSRSIARPPTIIWKSSLTPGPRPVTWAPSKPT
jgi:small conductance mechanosensitive channel